MGLIDLVITVCAVAQISSCHDQHLQFADGADLKGCVMAAPPYIAQWIGEHPKWMAVRWHCEHPGRSRSI
jgi:hypothetical protein